MDFSPISERILIIKLDALGDVLRTTSVLPALKDRYPHSAITWITRQNAQSLLSNRYIDRCLVVEDHYLEFILNERFDLGICLDADPLSATILSLADCQEKRGFIADENGAAIPANTEAEEWWLMGLNDHVKKQNRKTYQEIMYEICGLDKQAHRPILPDSIVNESLIETFKNHHGIPSDNKTVIGINTGGGSRWQWKKWPLDYYISLLQTLKNHYPNLPIILYGGPEEIEFNKEIENNIQSGIIDVGCTNSINDFVSLVAISDIFLTPDSLGFHIATALEITTFVLVGPTSPWELDVYGKGEVLYPELDCIACYLERCDRDPNCMRSLTPEIVFEKIEKSIERNRRP